MKVKNVPVSIAVVILFASGFSQYSQAADDKGTAIMKAELLNKNFTYPSDLVNNADQTQLANYAWRLFIASMLQTKASLTSGSGRAVADGTHNFINTGATPAASNPLVFESFYHRTEAFPYYTSSKPASPIMQVPTYYTYYQDSSEKKVAKTVKKANYVYLDETNQISQNFLYYRLSGDPDFPVLFMAKVNQIEAEYALSDKRDTPSATKSWDFPDQILEIKTAWRRTNSINESKLSKYHQATANYWLANSQGIPTLKTDTFALIAIHIIQKTANYPEFIFTTFEHIDAVTRIKSSIFLPPQIDEIIFDPAYKTEYNKLAYQSPNQEPHIAKAYGAYNVNLKGQSAKSNKLTKYTLPAAGTISTDYIPVVQPKTIIREVNDVNNQVNALVKSLDKKNIWANYRLKGVQAIPTSDSTSSNYYLANIVVESSRPGIQLFSGILLNGGVEQDGYLVNCRGEKGNTSCLYPESAKNASTLNADPPTTYNNVSLNVTQDAPVPEAKYNMGGCQGCHGAAQQIGRDFSFLANGVLGKGKELDSVPAYSLTAKQKTAHNKAMAKSSNAD